MTFTALFLILCLTSVAFGDHCTAGLGVCVPSFGDECVPDGPPCCNRDLQCRRHVASPSCDTVGVTSFRCVKPAASSRGFPSSYYLQPARLGGIFAQCDRSAGASAGGIFAACPSPPALAGLCM